MNSEETIKIILGSSLITNLLFLLGWVKEFILEKRKREAEFLREQIQNLYGPLFLYVCHNKAALKHSVSLIKAYQVKYEGEKWSQDSQTQASLQKETSATIELSNAYISKIVKNNNQNIVDLLKRQSHYIDVDDYEVCVQFIMDQSRLEIETDETGKLKTPLEIYREAGKEISFIRPEFMSAVEKKYLNKQEKLKGRMF